jgi:UDP-N-acetylglucosamine:LPS N-acetylglucosamine transferase
LADSDALPGELIAMLADPEALRTMGERARTLARPDAVGAIAEMVVGLAKA